MNDPIAVPELRGPTAAAGCRWGHIKWFHVKCIGFVLIAVSVAVIGYQIPLVPVIRALDAWIADIGIWGPVLIFALYVIAVVFMFPGTPLTLITGALFGLAGGMAVAWLAATTGLSLTFLIGRYVARERVARTISRYPKFAAIDRAISKGGWRVVVMVRLSPLIPFNLKNYLFGLTGIGFWPCVLTSWVAILPGTFFWVYVGHFGRAGLHSLANGDRSWTLLEWIMMSVGLLATIVLAFYLTRLARRELMHYEADTGSV